jgi:hypothetical protein
VRYPLKPLMDAARIPSMVALRRLFPMNGTDYRRVLDEGLSEWQADRWAVKLGLHPGMVWPQWFDLPIWIDDTGRAKKIVTEIGQKTSTGTTASLVRAVERRLKAAGATVELHQLRGMSLAERAILAAREAAEPSHDSETVAA